MVYGGCFHFSFLNNFVWIQQIDCKYWYLQLCSNSKTDVDCEIVFMTRNSIFTKLSCTRNGRPFWVLLLISHQPTKYCFCFQWSWLKTYKAKSSIDIIFCLHFLLCKTSMEGSAKWVCNETRRLTVLKCPKTGLVMGQVLTCVDNKNWIVLVGFSFDKWQCIIY